MYVYSFIRKEILNALGCRRISQVAFYRPVIMVLRRRSRPLTETEINDDRPGRGSNFLFQVKQRAGAARCFAGSENQDLCIRVARKRCGDVGCEVGLKEMRIDWPNSGRCEYKREYLSIWFTGGMSAVTAETKKWAKGRAEARIIKNGPVSLLE